MSRLNRWVQRAHLASVFGASVMAAGLLASSAAHAEVGTVLVTAGENHVIDSGGDKSAVQVGIDLNNGDTIETGQRGHLQLRFVDGAIVSLRPRSVFRIDDYQMQAEKPRSFLSLLRGALRTATGSISKRSPGAYRLTTPSATIGVRGTHFVARETVCDGACPPGEKSGLHVSVSEGGITVSNDQGTIDLNAGQSAWVPGADQAPVKTALAPVLSPRAYQPDQPPVAERPWREPVRLARGENKTVNTPGASTGETDRDRSADKSAEVEEPGERDPEQLARADTPGNAGRSDQASRSGEPDTTNGSTPSADAETPGQSAQSEPIANPGQADRADRSNQSNGPADQAAPAPTDAPDSANRVADRDGSERRDSAAATDRPAAPGPVASRLPDDAFASGPSDGFSDLGELPDPVQTIATPRDDRGAIDLVQWLPPQQTGAPDASNPPVGAPDPADDQASADPGNSSDPSDPSDPSSPPDPPNPGDPADPAPAPAPGSLTADRLRIELRAVPGVSRLGLVANRDATVHFDAETRLESIGACPNMFCLSRGTARVAEAGHDEYAAWGRWTDGSIETRVLGITSRTPLTDRQGLHYLAGVPAVSLPAQGTFGYSLIAATAPTTTGLGWAPGQFTGSAAVQFGPGVAARVGIEGQIDIGYDRFTFASRGGVADPGSSQLTVNEQAGFNGQVDGQAGTSAPWFCGQHACNVRVGGALMGSSGERLGVGYSVISESGSTTIDGAAVFGRN